MIQLPNIAVDWASLHICVYKVPGSNVGPESYYLSFINALLTTKNLVYYFTRRVQNVSKNLGTHSKPYEPEV
jgi:hypothetical protein